MGVARAGTVRRWSTVAVATAVVVAAPLLWLGRPVAASGPGPDALLRAARASASVPFEGYAETRGNLGLPDLPRLDAVAALLGSTTRDRVWWGSSRNWRVDTVTPTGESRISAVGGVVHMWDYERRLAREVVNTPPVRLPRPDDLLPPQATRRLLAGMGTDVDVRRLPARRVAGRAADGVRLVSRQADSTVSRADLWIDPGTGLPVALDLYARGGTMPALTSRFLDLRLRAPDPAELRTGDVARSLEVAVPVADIASALDTFLQVDLPDRLGGFGRSPDIVTLGGSATFGTGLARFVALPLPGRLGGDALEAALGGGGGALDVAPSQAVLVQTPLLTVAVVQPEVPGRDPTFLLAGTITPAAMQRVVSDLVAADQATGGP